MTQRIRVEIEGMSCGHCVRGVQGALETLSGVEVEKVEIGSAVVSYDPAAVKQESIEAAIAEEGYTVRRLENA